MQTVRQAFTILKQNPLLSTISILGTAFAITMIIWGIERNGFFNGRGKWVKGFENQRV